MLKIKDNDGNTIIVKEYVKSEEIVGITTNIFGRAYIYKKVSFFKVNGKVYERTQTFTKVIRWVSGSSFFIFITPL